MRPFVLLAFAFLFPGVSSFVAGRGGNPAEDCDTSRAARLIVAEACVPLLPIPIRDALGKDKNRWLELAAASQPIDQGSDDSPHFVMLDVGSGEVRLAALRVAAAGFPRDRTRGMELMNSRARAGETGGALPWALVDAAGALTEALRASSIDCDAVAERCAWIAHLATDASMPSHTTRLRFHLNNHSRDDMSNDGSSVMPEQLAIRVAQALATAESDWMVRLDRRLSDEAKVSPVRVRRLPDPTEAVFVTLLESHASMELIARAVMGNEGGSDESMDPNRPPDESPKARGEQARATFETADRVAPLLEDRLESAILLTANLITTAWHNAGKPEIEKGDGKADESSGESLPPVSGGFVGSRQSMVFHRPDCPHARRLSDVNRIRFESHAQATAAGRKPCKRCQPSP